MSKTVRLPSSMETVRYKAQRQVDLPTDEIPLVGGPNDSPEKQVQERYIAHAKVFDLSKEDQRLEYESVYQLGYDGLALISASETNFNPNTGAYMVFVRWATKQYIAPTA